MNSNSNKEECKHEEFVFNHYMEREECLECGLLKSTIEATTNPVETSSKLVDVSKGWESRFQEFWGDRIIGFPAGGKRVFIDSPKMELELPRLKQFIAQEISKAVNQRSEEIVEEIEKIKPLDENHSAYWQLGYARAKSDFKQAIRTKYNL